MFDGLENLGGGGGSIDRRWAKTKHSENNSSAGHSFPVSKFRPKIRGIESPFAFFSSAVLKEKFIL